MVLRGCSAGCGKKETSEFEFDNCSRCKSVCYCSVKCQTLHWKSGHKAECKKLRQVRIQGPTQGVGRARGARCVRVLTWARCVLRCLSKPKPVRVAVQSSKRWRRAYVASVCTWSAQCGSLVVTDGTDIADVRHPASGH